MIELVNGDHLRGVPTPGPLKLTTVFGSISLRTEHMKRLRVCPAGAKLPLRLKDALPPHCSFNDDEGGDVEENSGKVASGKVTLRIAVRRACMVDKEAVAA